MRSNDLRNYAVRLSAAAADAVRRAGEHAAAQARANVPVETGALRASIESGMTGAYECSVSAGTDHAAFAEFGTEHRAAQPFLEPAAHEAAEALASELKTMIQGIGGMT